MAGLQMNAEDIYDSLVDCTTDFSLPADCMQACGLFLEQEDDSWLYSLPSSEWIEMESAISTMCHVTSFDIDALEGKRVANKRQRIDGADVRHQFCATDEAELDNSSHSDVTDKSSSSSTSTRSSKTCAWDGCVKFPQGRTPFCIQHGGGRRCTVPNCNKGARDRFFCVGHGGGKRCAAENCTKSAVGGSSVCSLHGGGKKCTFDGCTKSAQSSTKLCVAHGGGRTCSSEGCTKVARGKTQFCSGHGGGVRCDVQGCGRAAFGKHKQCRLHHAAAALQSHMVTPLLKVTTVPQASHL